MEKSHFFIGIYGALWYSWERYQGVAGAGRDIIRQYGTEVPRIMSEQARLLPQFEIAVGVSFLQASPYGNQAAQMIKLIDYKRRKTNA